MESFTAPSANGCSLTRPDAFALRAEHSEKTMFPTPHPLLCGRTAERIGHGEFGRIEVENAPNQFVRAISWLLGPGLYLALGTPVVCVQVNGDWIIYAATLDDD